MYETTIILDHPLAAVQIGPLGEPLRRVVPPPLAVQPPPPPDPTPRLIALVESLHEAIHELELRRQQSWQELQQAAIELAIAAASHVIGASIDAGQFNLEGLVQSALDKLGWKGPNIVFLNPDDLELLQSRQALPDTTGRVEWRADPSLERGACRAERTDGVGVISDVGRQLSDIRRHWLEDLDDAQIERRRAAGDGQSLRRFPDRRETA